MSVSRWPFSQPRPVGQLTKEVLATLKAKADGFKDGVALWTKDQVEDLKHLAAGFDKDIVGAIKAKLPQLNITALKILLVDCPIAAIVDNVKGLGEEV